MNYPYICVFCDIKFICIGFPPFFKRDQNYGDGLYSYEKNNGRLKPSSTENLKKRPA